MYYRFEIPVIPMAIQSARFAKIGNFMKSYQPKKNTHYKEAIKLSVQSQLPKDFKILESSLEINWSFIFPPLSNFSKKIMEEISNGKIFHKSTKPDMDNLLKGTTDALNGIIWYDDAQIVEVSARKYFGLEPKIILIVHELLD